VVAYRELETEIQTIAEETGLTIHEATTDGDLGPLSSPGDLVMGASAMIGRYRALRQLGAGGMGEVYLAWDSGLDREIAVKVIRRAPAECTARLTAQFKTEARAMAQLNHPHILTIYEIGETNGHPFMAMELAPGGSLKDAIERDDLPTTIVLKLFVQVADALAAIHRTGMVHRDIKPANILLDANGEARICDFGIAGASPPTTAPSQISLQTSDRSENPPSRRAGTPAYTAPEQESGSKVDGRADQFAFCVSLFRALFGHLPERGFVSNVPQTRTVHGQRETIPQRICDLLLRGLLPRRDDRFECMDQIYGELKLAMLSVHPSPETTTPPDAGTNASPKNLAIQGQRHQVSLQFSVPTFLEDIQLKDRLAAVPEGTFTRGMVLQSTVEQTVKRAGVRPESARDRYFPFKSYPVAEYMRLLVEASRLAYPDLTPAEGLRQQGFLAYDTVRSSSLGRIVGDLAGNDCGAFIRHAAQTYVPLSSGRAIIVPRGPCSIEVRLRNLWTFPEIFHFAIFEQALRSLPIRTSLTARVHGFSSADLLIAWEPSP